MKKIISILIILLSCCNIYADEEIPVEPESEYENTDPEDLKNRNKLPAMKPFVWQSNEYIKINTKRTYLLVEYSIYDESNNLVDNGISSFENNTAQIVKINLMPGEIYKLKFLIENQKWQGIFIN